MTSMNPSEDGKAAPQGNVEFVNRESHLRSLLKGLTWRVLATLTTICVAYFILHERDNALHEAAMIGAVEFFAKLGIYYLHERAWQKVPIGTVRKMAGNSKKP